MESDLIIVLYDFAFPSFALVPTLGMQLLWDDMLKALSYS